MAIKRNDRKEERREDALHRQANRHNRDDVAQLDYLDRAPGHAMRERLRLGRRMKAAAAAKRENASTAAE